MVDLFTVVLRGAALAGLPMLAIYSVPVAVYTNSVNPIPFVIGAAGFLWLLVSDNVDKVRRFGRRPQLADQSHTALVPDPASHN